MFNKLRLFAGTSLDMFYNIIVTFFFVILFL